MLLVCNKLSQNLVASNNTHLFLFLSLLFYTFCAPGSWAQLSWAASGSLTGCSQVAAGAMVISKFQPHTVVLAGFSSSRAIRLRISAPHWLLSRGYPQVLAMWVSPPWQPSSSKPANQEGKRKSASKMNIRAFYNLTFRVTFSSFSWYSNH